MTLRLPQARRARSRAAMSVRQLQPPEPVAAAAAAAEDPMLARLAQLEGRVEKDTKEVKTRPRASVVE